MSIIYTERKKKRKPNKNECSTSLALKLHQKVGMKDKSCTTGRNTDLFLWINGIRSIESIKVNNGATVSTKDGKIGKVYFGSFPSMGKIKFYSGRNMVLYNPKDLTIISFF